MPARYTRMSTVASFKQETSFSESSSISPLQKVTEIKSTISSLKVQGDENGSPKWISGTEMVFKTPDSPSLAKTRRRTEMILLGIASKRASAAADFKIPSLIFNSPPGVKTRSRRSSMYVNSHTKTSQKENKSIIKLSPGKQGAGVKRAGRPRTQLKASKDKTTPKKSLVEVVRNVDYPIKQGVKRAGRPRTQLNASKDKTTPKKSPAEVIGNIDSDSLGYKTVSSGRGKKSKAGSSPNLNLSSQSLSQVQTSERVEAGENFISDKTASPKKSSKRKSSRRSSIQVQLVDLSPHLYLETSSSLKRKKTSKTSLKSTTVSSKIAKRSAQKSSTIVGKQAQVTVQNVDENASTPVSTPKMSKEKGLLTVEEISPSHLIKTKRSVQKEDTVYQKGVKSVTPRSAGAGKPKKRLSETLQELSPVTAAKERKSDISPARKQRKISPQFQSVTPTSQARGRRDILSSGSVTSKASTSKRHKSLSLLFAETSVKSASSDNEDMGLIRLDRSGGKVPYRMTPKRHPKMSSGTKKNDLTGNKPFETWKPNDNSPVKKLKNSIEMTLSPVPSGKNHEIKKKMLQSSPKQRAIKSPFQSNLSFTRNDKTTMASLQKSATVMPSRIHTISYETEDKPDTPHESLITEQLTLGRQLDFGYLQQSRLVPSPLQNTPKVSSSSALNFSLNKNTSSPTKKLITVGLTEMPDDSPIRRSRNSQSPVKIMTASPLSCVLDASYSRRSRITPSPARKVTADSLLHLLDGSNAQRYKNMPVPTRGIITTPSQGVLHKNSSSAAEITTASSTSLNDLDQNVRTNYCTEKVTGTSSRHHFMASQTAGLKKWKESYLTSDTLDSDLYKASVLSHTSRTSSSCEGKAEEVEDSHAEEPAEDSEEEEGIDDIDYDGNITMAHSTHSQRCIIL